MAAKTTALHSCECSNWEFDLDVDRDDDYNTGCTAQTVRIFAQGHDAKLVGFMVRAEIAGHDISKRDGGMLVTFAGAVEAAASISEALATKAEAQIAAAKTRAEKKASKPARKAKGDALSPLPRVTPAQAAPAPAPVLAEREARIKVGRWTYDATIDAAGVASYKTKLGKSVMLASSEYKEM